MRNYVEDEFGRAMRQDTDEPTLPIRNIAILAAAAATAMFASFMLVKQRKPAKELTHVL